MGPIRQIGRRMMNVVIKGQGEYREIQKCISRVAVFIG